MSNPFGVMSLESYMANSKELIRFQPHEGMRPTYDSHMVEMCFGPGGPEHSVRSRSNGKQTSCDSRLSTAGRVPQQRLSGWLAETCREITCQDSSTNQSNTPKSESAASIPGSRCKGTTSGTFRTSELLGRKAYAGRSISVGGRLLTSERVPQQRCEGWPSETRKERFLERSQRITPHSDILILPCDANEDVPTMPASARAAAESSPVDCRTHYIDENGDCSNFNSNQIEQNSMQSNRSARQWELPPLRSKEICERLPAYRDKTAGEMILAHDFRKSIRKASRAGSRTSRSTASQQTTASCDSARTSFHSARGSSCTTTRRFEHWRFSSPRPDLLTDNCSLPWKV